MDEAIPATPPEPPPPAPPPRRRFWRPFFRWCFGFSLPIAVLAGAVAIYVHEFAHGLTALATGGYFTGIQGDFLAQGRPSMAFADAQSEDWFVAVFLAGIAVNVAIGLVLFRRAARAPLPRSRLLLLHFAAAFLGDLHYAYEGSLFWRSADFDMAAVLERAGSPSLRLSVLILSFVANVGVLAALSRAQFRAWEEVFGPLSAWRAFWVVALLIAPIQNPSHRGDGHRQALLATLVVFVGITVWLIRGRRRGLEDPAPLPARAALNWLGGLAGVAAFAVLQLGIRLGTYADVQLFDLRVQDQAVAGLASRYGMGDRQGANRPHYEPRLFVSTPDGCRYAPSPTKEVVDLAWLPATRRFLVVAPWVLHEVALDTGESRELWRSPRERFRAAGRGPDGQLLLAIERGAGLVGEWPALYVFDPRTGKGELHEATALAGNPRFEPGRPVRAQVSVGADLWRFTWEERPPAEVALDRLEGASKAGWFEGSSSGKPWFSDAEGWVSGGVRVANEDLSAWGAAAEGFVTVDEAGRWTLTRPQGEAPRSGTIDIRAFRMLSFPEGRPWVVNRGGEVQPLEASAPSFRVRLPPISY